MTSAEWPLRTIAECALDEPYATQIGPFGKAILAEDYTPDGVPVLRGVNVNRGRFHDDDFVFISDEAADKLAKFESFPDDVLLVHRGTLGQIGLMPPKRRFPRYILGNSMLRVRSDPKKLLPLYLYYWLSSPGGQAYLASRVSQVGVPALQRPLTTLREAKLPVPPVEVQAAIVEKLDAFDSKLELNERTNRTLDTLARAVFRAWFVDFLPVRAKAAGAVGFLGMPQGIFEQLPDALIESSLGEIPKGWPVVPFSEIVTLRSGGTPKRKVAEYWDGNIPWYSVRDAPAEHDVWVHETTEHITEAGTKSSAAKVLRPGTTVISARGTVGKLALTAVPMAINQSCYGVQGCGGFGDYFTYFCVLEAVTELKQRSHGSVFDTITRATFDSLQTVRPPDDLLAAFEAAVGPYLGGLRGNGAQTLTLTKVRDGLLPQLVPGDVLADGSGVVGGDAS